MQHDPINALRIVLTEFDEVLAEFAPDVWGTLRPGLADEAVDGLVAQLYPFKLPRDLQVLYSWHDGQYPHSPDPHRPIFHDAEFLPLEAAIESYNGWRRAHLNWNPLWFPAFGWRWGLLVILRRATGEMAGPLWAFDGENPNISTSYDSIVSLVKTATAAWQEADHIELDFLGPDVDMRREHNPSSVRPNGRPRLTLSMYDTDNWPSDWVEAATGRLGQPED